jgi:DNA-binding LacI/PurR family transcriptional regulator
MMGVNRDDKGIERLVKANYPLVFVGRREVADVSTHWVTFDYQKVICQMVDHLSGVCPNHSFVYVESQEQEREPRKDKRRFLMEAAQAHGLEVLIVQADERNKISEKDFEIIEQSKVVVFDRLFLLEPFERLMERKGLKVGSDLWGAVLEDDWMGGHEHWTRWSNQRLELGSLAVEYLSHLLQKDSLEQLDTLTPLHLVIAESSAFTE